MTLDRDPQYPAEPVQNLFSLGDRHTAALVLTGPRSVGKTTVAQLLSAQLGIAWYDTDVLVDTALQQRYSHELSPPTGEPLPYLAKAMQLTRFEWISEVLEESCLRLAASPANFILAAAGGAFSYPATAQALHKMGIVLGIMPAPTIEDSATVLQAREISRPHFQMLSAADVAARCRAHVEQVFQILEDHADDTLHVGTNSPEAVTQLITSRYTHPAG